MIGTDFKYIWVKYFLMSDLTRIRKPVEKEMADFESYFSRTMRSNIPLLNIIQTIFFAGKGSK